MTTLADRVCLVMADVGAISKDKKNDFHKYDYVSAEALRAKVQKACAKHGLILQLTYSHEQVGAHETILKAHCSASTDGQTWVLLGEGWGAGLDKTEKSPMKACTAAAKYALANAFCIALGEDPEADASVDRDAASAVVIEHQRYKQSLDDRELSRAWCGEADSFGQALKRRIDSGETPMEKAEDEAFNWLRREGGRVVDLLDSSARSMAHRRIARISALVGQKPDWFWKEIAPHAGMEEAGQ
jgi:hypothetical protein